MSLESQAEEMRNDLKKIGESVVDAMIKSNEISAEIPLRISHYVYDVSLGHYREREFIITVMPLV